MPLVPTTVRGKEDDKVMMLACVMRRKSYEKAAVGS